MQWLEKPRDRPRTASSCEMNSVPSQAAFSRRTSATTGSSSRAPLGAYRVHTMSAAQAVECLFYGDGGLRECELKAEVLLSGVSSFVFFFFF